VKSVWRIFRRGNFASKPISAATTALRTSFVPGHESERIMVEGMSRSKVPSPAPIALEHPTQAFPDVILGLADVAPAASSGGTTVYCGSEGNFESTS